MGDGAGTDPPARASGAGIELSDVRPRATEPSERRWGAFKHGGDGRWDAAGTPASEAVADATALARACASKNRSWVETGRGHVPCAFVIM